MPSFTRTMSRDRYDEKQRQSKARNSNSSYTTTALLDDTVSDVVDGRQSFNGMRRGHSRSSTRMASASGSPSTPSPTSPSRPIATDRTDHHSRNFLEDSDEIQQTSNYRETREVYMSERAKDTLMEDMYTMFIQREKFGADFKFKVANRIFRCHRAVIMVRLKAYYCPAIHDKTAVVNLPKHFQPDAFEAVLLYLYTAKVPHNFSMLSISILPIAAYFSCDELVNRCELDLVTHLKAENSVTILDVARKEKRDHLQYKAAKFIKKNIDLVRKTESYQSFLDADESNCRVLLEIVTQTLKRPTSVSSMSAVANAPSPPPYDMTDDHERRLYPVAPGAADNENCFMPL